MAKRLLDFPSWRTTTMKMCRQQPGWPSCLETFFSSSRCLRWEDVLLCSICFFNVVYLLVPSVCKGTLWVIFATHFQKALKLDGTNNCCASTSRNEHQLYSLCVLLTPLQVSWHNLQSSLDLLHHFNFQWPAALFFKYESSIHPSIHHAGAYPS